MAHTLQHSYLTLPLPDSWEDASQIIALGADDNGFRPNLVFSHEPTKPGESAAEFAARQLPQLRAALTNFAVVEEGVARFGPNEGFLRDQTFSMERGEIRQLQFYVVMGMRVFTFTFTHLRDRLTSVRPLAESLFAQARIRPPATSRMDDDML
jgi:hypothetical protein